MSPVSSGSLSGAQACKIPGGRATGREWCANMQVPDRWLLESKSPVPWCWRVPFAANSPIIPAGNLKASQPLSLSASSGNRTDQQFSRSRSESSSSTSIVVLLQKLGSASNSTRQIMELVRTSEEQFKDDKHMLAKVYHAAVEVYSVPQQGMPVDEFCDLSVKCIRVLCQVDPVNARKFHCQLQACSLRRSDARIHEAFASMEEHLGSVTRAIEILQQGLELDAQPSAILHRMLQRLQAGGGRLRQPQQEVNSMQEANCQTSSATVLQTPSSGELRPDARSGWTTKDETNMHFASLCEEVSLMRSMMEQNLRVQLAVQRDLQDLRAQREGTLFGTSCCQGHACLRCCREAVEGAVETLMTSLVGVRGSMHMEGTLQPMHDWQPLADEVWDCVSRPCSKRRRCETQGLCFDPNTHRVQQQLAASFAESPELLNIVDRHLSSAKRQANIDEGEAEHNWEPLPRQGTATKTSHLVRQEPLQRQRAAPLLALGEHLERDAYKENVCPKSPEHGHDEFMSKPLHYNGLPVSHSFRCLR